MKAPYVLLAAFMMAGCTDATSPMGGYQPIYDSWKATVAKTGITTDNSVYLGGTELNGIQKHAEAKALVAANRGKQGSVVGYVRKVDVNGNKAAIEIIPVYSAENAMRCAGRGYTNPVGCLAQNRAIWQSAVTCHVNDIAALNKRIGENIKQNADARWQRRSAWAHVLVAGTISKVDLGSVSQARSFTADGSFDGVLGGTTREGFRYSKIHITNCRVATYRSKLVPQT